jgi:hypothetical protein
LSVPRRLQRCCLLNARRRASCVSTSAANLPEALHGFTIAQISDVHVGPTIKRGRSRRSWMP